MKIESFEGIVLSETNYSESSKILNIFTKEHGLIGVMSKGCRNMKSKLRGVSRKMICGVFNMYYKENGVSTLISVDIINSYSNTLMDLEKISYSSYIIDLVYQVARQNDDITIYELLKSSLNKIDDGINPMNITNILEIKLLDYLGIGLNVDSCVLCGSNKGIVTVSSDHGGYICRNCYNNEVLLSSDTIKTFRLYYYVDINSIKKLDIDSKVTFEINRFLSDYYDRYSGLYIKSKDFVKRVNILTDKN